MINEDNGYYVIEHVKADLRLNQRLSGRDYSPELGAVLLAYTSFGREDPDAFLFATMSAMSELEEGLQAEVGKPVMFPETRKCALPFSKMVMDNDKEGLTRVIKFANDLIAGGRRQ
jgi:hypothetical protein